MSKLIDRLIAEAIFSKKEPKVKKKEITFKDYVKFQKDLKEFEEWQKSQKKDDKKKPEDDSWWGKLSVVQRAFYLTLFGPLLGMLWMLAIVKFAVMIGQSVGLR